MTATSVLRRPYALTIVGAAVDGGPVRGGRRGGRTQLALGLSRRGGPGRRGDRLWHHADGGRGARAAGGGGGGRLGFRPAAGWAPLYRRISTLVLALSEPGQEGFNTAAKSIADSIGASVSLALAGLIFAGLGDTTTRTPYVGVLVLTSATALAVVAVAARAVSR